MGIVLTCFTKVGGPLTKEISIVNGALKSDGSKCVMGRGHAQRVRLDNLGQLMARVESNQALGLGRLRDDLPDCVRIMTKDAAAKLNGSLPADTITRTVEAIDYTPGEAAVALIDFDQKGMPTDVRTRVAAAGGCDLSGSWDSHQRPDQGPARLAPSRCLHAQKARSREARFLEIRPNWPISRNYGASR
jgi:hypothetical protein